MNAEHPQRRGSLDRFFTQAIVLPLQPTVTTLWARSRPTDNGENGCARSTLRVARHTAFALPLDPLNVKDHLADIRGHEGPRAGQLIC